MGLKDVKGFDLPRYIYKYTSLKRLKDILKNGGLYFQSPLRFNDPFDCQLVTDLNSPLDVILEHFEKNNNENYYNAVFNMKLNKQQIKDKALEISKNIDLYTERFNNVIRRNLDNRGVSCFTKDNKNLLMWSHYADSHKGVCLKFDLTKDIFFFSVPIKVEYSLDYPKLKYFESTMEEFFFPLIATKSKIWEYEDEVRIFTDKGFKKFRKEALQNIYFGIRTDEKEIKIIKKLLVRNQYDHVKCFNSTQSTNKFGIEFHAQ